MYTTWLNFEYYGDSQVYCTNWSQDELGEKLSSVLFPVVTLEYIKDTALYQAIKTKQVATATNDFAGFGMLDVMCIPVGDENGNVVFVAGFYREHKE